MFPVSRRIIAYWLLLLIPALGMGVGAIVLLRQEEARLADRATYADEARRAAVAARARLIAENVELLVGDVENGLLDVLAAEPAGTIGGLLDQLEKSNPLVRATFQCALDGKILRPAADGATDDGRGFLRRFGAQLRESPPWRPAANVTDASKLAIVPEARPAKEELAQLVQTEPFANQQEAGPELSKAQSARRDVQQLTQNSNRALFRDEFPTIVANTSKDAYQSAPAVAAERRSTSAEPSVYLGDAAKESRARVGRQSADTGNLSAPAATAAAAKPGKKEDAQQMDAEELANRLQVFSNVSKVQSARRDVRSLAQNNYVDPARAESTTMAGSAHAGVSKPAPPAASAAASAPPAPDVFLSEVEKKSPAGKAKEADADRSDDRVVPATPEQRGWEPVEVDGRLHLLGWVRPAGATDVRGVELEMAGLISRLGGSLPAESSGEEGYALHDELGRVLHQVGAVGRATPAITIPLAGELLPGWEVVAYVPAVIQAGTANGAFFLISSLLVGLFVLAIVAGGSLLVRQARRSEAEAAQKTSFVANVSHEFKTPLTTIRLYAELLEQGRVRDAAQSGEYLRTIGRETQRLARLVGNALDFSRLEQGWKKYVREEFDLRVELARLLDTHALWLAETGVGLKRDLPEQPFPVTSDRDALEQILLNLLDNAAKYGAAGGEVTVELATRATGGAEVRVLDRGPGVPAEHRERIFDKFHRVDDTLTAEKTGAGLGLSIARQLARGLGGELRYASREGGGACFVLELP